MINSFIPYIHICRDAWQQMMCMLWNLIYEQKLCWEMLIVILLTILIFQRRKLSSNNEYRSKAVTKYPTITTQTQLILLETIAFMTNEFSLPKYQSGTSRDVKPSRLHSNDFLSPLPLTQCGHTSSNSIRDHDSQRRFNVFMILSDDVMFKIIDYLSMKELVLFSTTCYSLNTYLRSDVVWKHLWMIRFGSMWNHVQIRRLCKRRGIEWYPMNENVSSNTLFAEYTRDVATSDTPKQGWMRFYIDFEYCWIDWLLAGLNTDDNCLIGFIFIICFYIFL